MMDKLVKKRQKKNRAKLPKWKLVEQKRRRDQLKQWGKAIGKLALILLLGFLAWQVICSFRASVWDGRQRLNLVVAASDIGLVSYEPASDSVVWLQVPNELMLITAYGYGEYRAGALVGLDYQEKMQGKLVKETLAQYLGTIVDGYILELKIKNEKLEVEDKGDLIDFVIKTLLAKAVGQRKTNLSPLDLVRLLKGLIEVREDKLEVINLAETNAVEKIWLPDGSAVYRADLQRLTILAEQWLVDESLVEEGIVVEIINTTDTLGLGGSLARILTTLGIHVVAVEDNDSNLLVSQINLARGDLRRSKTVLRLERMLGVKSLTENVKADDRVEVVVLIGDDYKKRVVGRN